MDSRQFIESGILETYAMGLASEQEAKQVAEMAARYPEVKAELAAVEASLENFDRKNAVEPPAYLKSAILKEIGVPLDAGEGESTGGKVRSLDSAPQVKPVRSYKILAIAASVALIVVLLYTNKLRDDIRQRDSQIASIQQSYDQVRSYWDSSQLTVLKLEHNIEILSKPGMKSIELKGMEVAPDAKAMVYANTSTGDSYLEIMKLPAPPEGMQYQFWGIVDGKPVDAGIIEVVLEGPYRTFEEGIHPMKSIPNAVAYAISLEPKGGSQQPTGKIYVMGNS